MNNLTPYEPEIRFADIDAMGHVNNAVYFSYFEQARIRFFRNVVGTEWDWNKHGILVAHNEIDYLMPIHLQDKVVIHVRLLDVGKKSFRMGYEVTEAGSGRLFSRGNSVLVCFDYHTRVTTEIPETWREQFSELMKTEKV